MRTHLPNGAGDGLHRHTDGQGSTFSVGLSGDGAGSTSVEVGKLDQLDGVISALISAVRAGELGAQLAAAAQERSKAFKRRSGATKAP